MIEEWFIKGGGGMCTNVYFSTIVSALTILHKMSHNYLNKDRVQVIQIISV